MKLKLKNLSLILGGSAAAVAGSSLTHASTVHAATVTVKVQHGDSAWKIAKAHKASLKQVIKDNHLKDNGNYLPVGAKLKVKEEKAFKNDYPAAAKSSKKKATKNSSAKTNTIFSTATTNTNVAPVQAVQARTAAVTPKTTTTQSTTSYNSPVSGSEQAAKNWIAQHESSGSYSAQNGQYVGKYQLSASYLHGDYSPANQERTADNYVKNRYGSWTAAQAFWRANGWY